MNLKYLSMLLLAVAALFRLWMDVLAMGDGGRSIPANVREVYDEETYRRWLAYEHERGRLRLIRHVVSELAAAVLLWFPIYAGLVERLGAAGPYLGAITVLVADGILSQLLMLPLEYAEVMGVEQRYGFNRTSHRTFAVDQVKDLVLGLVVTCALCCLFVALHRALGQWLIVAFFGVLLAIVLLIVFLSPLIVRLRNKLTPLQEGELKERLTALLTENGCSVRGIYVSDGSKRSSKANAYFSGFGKMKTIVLYDTLLEQLSEDEIIAVFAHELGHSRHRDTLKQYAASAVSLLLFVLLAWGLVQWPELYEPFGFHGLNYGFALFLLTNVFLEFLSPLLGIFTNTLSRRLEYRADRFAAEKGYGEALISALKKLSRNNLASLTPHPVVVALTYSHPTVSRRVAEIRGAEQGVS